MLIFDKKPCVNYSFDESELSKTIPETMLRKVPFSIPRCSELEVVRHYTRLSTQNFSIDTHFYPLGSCTMKYNPKAAHFLATLPGFSGRHPHAHFSKSQGFLSCLYELQDILSHKELNILPPPVPASTIAAFHQLPKDEIKKEVQGSESQRVFVHPDCDTLDVPKAEVHSSDSEESEDD